MQTVYAGTAGADSFDASTGRATDITVFRNLGANDTAIGGAGADRFSSTGTGASMSGGGGNDQFFIALSNTPGGARDSIDGGAGRDELIIAASSYQMTAAVQAELGRLAGFLAGAGDPDARFISDILRLDMTGVEVARVRLDGVLKTLAELLPGPTAAADSFQAEEDSPITVGAAQGLLANDSGSGALAVTAGTLATALGGSVTIATDGSFTYSPAANANGTDSFSYTVTDALGRTTTGTATIEVAAVNDAPVLAAALADQSVTAGDAFSFTIPAGSFTDPDAGTTLTYSARSADGSALPAWLSFDAATGAFSGTPATAGTFSVTVTASDGSLSASDSFDIVVAQGSLSVSLSSLTADQGFKIIGEAAGDNAGISVSDAGDVNGDGYADLLIGAYGNAAAGYYAGAAYVVFGSAAGATVDLAQVAAGTGGFKIIAETSVNVAGYAVSAAGDVNGDGLADLLVSAHGHDPYYRPDVGAAYVVFGKTDGSAVRLSDVAAGIGGFKIVGEGDWDRAGFALSAAGDLNGDGYADLLVSAVTHDVASQTWIDEYWVPYLYYDDYTREYYDLGYYDGGYYYTTDYAPDAGAAYVVWGKADGGQVWLSNVADGYGGFKITGEAADDNAGYAVANIGDLNNDGITDLLIGAPYNDGNGDNAGAAYVVFGKANGMGVTLADIAAGTGGFKIIGEAAGDTAGITVTGAGDVNGDGIADLLVGANYNDAAGDNAGAAYVVFGKADTATVNLADVAAGIGGFKIVGEAAGDEAGRAVAAAGDVNGDGYADLLVGAPYNDAEGILDAGAVYLVFGKASGTAVDLADIARGIGGFKINGASYRDETGFSVSAAGDVNGDSYADLLIGANFDDTKGTDAGAAYVLYGRADWIG
ncbi:putative Ig domain-containing protein [Roseicella aerolata]|uniref:Ig domain-containing protein n=1 Tax=Roseicella aerolata TaxID=2883479 RepID=A0A9X1I8S6_9PROT|nr:putative Ig domain-containing protein [Roseicella aerolata]MCB4820356.1 putative Ig domain-containing protein [Roseicella aerolata]